MNRSLLSRRLKGQTIRCDERMLLRDDLCKYIVMPNGDSRQGWVVCVGNTESPVAQKQRDEKKTGERNYPASDWHRKSFSIRDRRAQAGWRSAIDPDRSASR
jgi:hypothetical protein